MSRMNRRRFTWVATSGIASAALVACGGDAVDEDLAPTQIPDVAGAPPTLAPNATPFSSEEAAGGDAAGGEQAAAGGGGPVTVNAVDIAFEPTEFSIPPDTDVEIHVVNEGALQHDFNIEETDYATEILEGAAEATITVNLPEGDYVYFCSVPGHREAGMEGTLHVTPDAAGAGGEGAAGEEEAVATPEEEAAASGGGGPVTVNAVDIAFEPTEFTIPTDTDVEIHVVNEGALQHDFNIEETDYATEILDAGAEETITVNLPEGEYVYFCSVPGHREAGMEGTLIVSADAGGDAAAAAEEGEGEEVVASEEGGDEAAAAGGGGEPVTVTAVDIAFEPTSFEVAPGQEIHVVNEGALQHDFVVDGMDLATELLDSGAEATITVPEDAEPGDYTYFCSVPGHREAGMEGTMTITAGGGSAASGETEETEAAAAGASDEAAAAPSGGEAVTVEAFDSLQFEPAESSAAPGQTITVINRGTLQHDFVIDEWGLATPLLNRDEEHQLVIPEEAKPGQSLTFYCSVPGHQAAGMEGTLTIAEGEAASAEATEQASAEATEEASAGGEVTTVQLDPNVIHVSALDSMRFAPSQFSAAPGQQIHLVNVGVLVHDIVVDEWGLDSGSLAGGDETTFRIPEDVEIGSEHEFYCSVPGHRESGMVGRVTIIEADVRQAEAVTPVAEESPAAELATPEAAATTPAEEAAAGGGGGETVKVIAVDIDFEPSELSIPADTDVQIHVVNEGALPHDFNIEETEYATEMLDSGQEDTITINLPAGEYIYFCSVPGHREAGMEGALTVE